MKLTQGIMMLVAATGLAVTTLPAMAYDAGDWLVRGRIINVNPNDDSGSLFIDGVNAGPGVKVDSDTVPELDITYMFNRNWGVELILGYSEHTVTGEQGIANLGDVINAKVLPPTLTLQYHFMPDAAFRPYAGIGVNYTYFFDEKTAGATAGTPGSKVSMESSWGLAAQLGVDIALNQDWFLNFDVKYLQMDTTAKFTNIANGAIANANINADIDPFVYGIGVGRRF